MLCVCVCGEKGGYNDHTQLEEGFTQSCVYQTIFTDTE